MKTTKINYCIAIVEEKSRHKISRGNRNCAGDVLAKVAIDAQAELTALTTRLAEAERLLGELVEPATRGSFCGGQHQDKQWYLECPICTRETVFDSYEDRKAWLSSVKNTNEYFCTNPDCPAVQTRKLLEAKNV